MTTIIVKTAIILLTSALAVAVFYLVSQMPGVSRVDDLLIDDFARADDKSKLTAEWKLVTDAVMGGKSAGALSIVRFEGTPCLRLTGMVKPSNDGGFVQAATLLSEQGDYVDATGIAGVRLTVRGNDERYDLLLRTDDTRYPWQYYYYTFDADTNWKTVDIPFNKFSKKRISRPLDYRHLAQIAVAATDRKQQVDVMVRDISFYR